MPLRDDLLKPIPGDNPSGANLRYDPLTDKIKEARREDLDVPQGDWQRTLKTADWVQVVKLAGEAIATKSKDLQLAVWLVEAHVRREGFAILPACFQFLRELIDQFWDTLYPEIEEGDLELRAAPLEWLGTKFEDTLRLLPITSNGLSWAKYHESRSVGYEKDADTDEKRKRRNQAMEDGRVAAEEFDQAVEESSREHCDKLYQNVLASIEAVRGLADYCDEKFGDYSPSLVKTRTTLEDLGQFVLKALNKKGGPLKAAPAAAEESEEEAAPAAAAQAVEAAPPPSAPKAKAAAAPAAGLEPVDKEDAIRRLGAIARFLRNQDPYDICSYLILRGLRWGEIRWNGSNIQPAMLEAPPSGLRAELKQFALAEDWDIVLETTEKAMELPCGRAWLDVQRYAVKALAMKGNDWAFVADAIRSSLRALLDDLPGLLELTLSDDTPVANPETMAWIKQEVLRAAPPASAEGREPPEREAEPETAVQPAAAADLESTPPPMDEAAPEGEAAPPDAFDLAMEAARRGDQREAIEILSRELATERSGRGRFRRRMQLAHLLMAGGKSEIAEPILQQLTEEIDQRKLEEWEYGDVLAYPLGLYLDCLRARGEDTELLHRVYARICRLDPLQALNRSE